MPLFPSIHIQSSTFHRPDCCDRLQTIRLSRQSEDRKPSRLPIRLKELSTSACFPTKRQVRDKRYEKDAEDYYKRIYLTSFCFPISQHRGINYPPTYVGPPFLSRKEQRMELFPFVNFKILTFCIRKPSASLLQSARIAPTRESNMDSCRLGAKLC